MEAQRKNNNNNNKKKKKKEKKKKKKRRRNFNHILYEKCYNFLSVLSVLNYTQAVPPNSFLHGVQECLK